MVKAIWEKSVKVTSVLFASFLLLAGCAPVASVNTNMGEEKVRLNAGNVQISEEQYKQIEDVRQELKHVLLDGTDAGKWEALCALLPKEDFRKAGSCELSSIPFIEWDYEKNDIYQIKLLAFSKDKSVFYFILLEYDNGRIDYENGGYKGSAGSVIEEIETLRKFPNKNFVGLRPDYYNSCLLSEDAHIYLADNLTVSENDFFGQFDFGRMGFRYGEATDAGNCIEVKAEDLQ